ncbi:MAG: LysR family transcriptional regulator [Janthinobacterium lividum]
MPRILDSRSLAMFLAVAETLSFRHAAQILHMSQPPLSRAIRELEERLGQRLFERSTSGVRLTEAGHRLMPYAQGVSDLLRQAEFALLARGVATAVRIGLTSAVEPLWFQGLAQRIGQRFPATMVSMQSETSPKLVRMLRAGKLDAAFVALPTDVAGLNVAELDRLPMVLAMPSSHRFARRETLGLADLAGEPVFWFERSRQPAFYDHCQKVFSRHGFAMPKLKEPADHHVLLAQVANGDGIALLAKSFTRLRRAGVVYRALEQGDELALGIGLATLEERQSVRDMLGAVIDGRGAGLDGGPLS